MKSLNFPIDANKTLVVDASVVINLNATGCAFNIISAIPNLLVVTKNVLTELLSGSFNGHNNGKELYRFIDSGVIQLVQLGETGIHVYASLVEGKASKTLDDGEAATIAYANECGAIAIIDEKKARSICANKFPGLTVISTTDLLTHEAVGNALGEEGQRNAIVRALQDARMRVPRHQIGMIVNLIGEETAATCNSLPRAAREGNGRTLNF